MALLALANQAPAQTQTRIPPPAIPRGHYTFWAITQSHEGHIYRLQGKAEIRGADLLARADQMEYNEDTGDVQASGNVYYHNFQSNEEIWCNRLEYNLDDEKGKFYDVRGEYHPRVVPRPGVLTGASPLHFEGRMAERLGDDHYVLFNGWLTNCKVPRPWWRLRGPKFDIVLEDRALAYDSWFQVRKVPIFFTPFFYHSLKKEPRKSGFLLPNIVPHSKRGPMFGVGYYWAINRSYDATYRFQDYTSHAFGHHLDFRGEPRARSDFDVILYAVQDRSSVSDPSAPTYSGVSLYAVGKSDLGDGWTAHGQANYISSFRFRQNWTESYNELIGGEIQSVGFINKNWSTMTFNAVFSRLQNFQTAEISVTDPLTGQTNLTTNAVTLRKLPEVQMSSRDHTIWKDLPVWFSFESTAGLLYRSEPIFDSSNTLVNRFATGQFMHRVDLAPHVTTALHWGPVDLVPSMGLDEAYYSEAQSITPSTQLGNVYGLSPSEGLYNVIGTNIFRSARDFSLDLILPSLARVYEGKTVFGDKLKHVIEPRVTYRYVTGIGEDFNRFIRFDESDLLANTNELALSVTNRIYAKRGDTVREIFTWELMQKRYFDPTFGGALLNDQRNVFASTADLTAYAFLVGPRSTSPVASVIRANPIGGLGIQWQADYDPRSRSIVDSSFSMDYHWRAYFVSAGNNEVHNNPLLTPAANEYRFGGGLGNPNHRGWNAGLTAVYNYREGILANTTAQVTYNTDCCGFSVQYFRYNAGPQQVSQLRIAFAVANIGSFGTLRKQDRMF